MYVCIYMYVCITHTHIQALYIFHIYKRMITSFTSFSFTDAVYMYCIELINKDHTFLILTQYRYT